MLSARTLIVLVICFSVSADDLQSSVNLPQEILSSNPFIGYRSFGNHPPSFENFDSVPFEEDHIEIDEFRSKKSVSEDNETKSGLRRRQRIPVKEKSILKNNSNIPVSQNVTKIDNNKNDSKIIEQQPRTFPKRPAEYNPVFKKRTGGKDPVVKIIRERNNVYSHTGNFHYSYESGDGTVVSSQGELKSVKNKAAGEAVSGSVFYKDKEGNDVSLTYTADENGYQPIGAHLPTSPPIPPQIARALAYLATRSTPLPVTEAYNRDLF